MNYIHGQCISLPTYGRSCWMTNCVELDITGRRSKNPQCQKSQILMSISATQIPTLTLDEINELTTSITSGIGTDTITYSPIWDTTGTVVPGYGAAIGGGTGYTYTSPNTVPSWIGTSTGTNTLSVEQSGTIELRGENPDIKINGKSMVTWMEKVEERLNILTPNPELEKEWDDLRRLGQRYRALEKKCREKAKMWEALKKVQPKQP
jgi:hypothetical protein